MTKARILLVDDELYASRSLAQYLDLIAGYEVHLAHSITQTIRLLEEKRDISCVVLDVMMPPEPPVSAEASEMGRLAGVVLGEYIRNLYPHLPLLGFSASENPIIEEWFTNHGAGYLRKPFTVREVAKALARIIGNERRVKVFIVHGHDEASKYALKNYLQNTLGLPEPIILHEQPAHRLTLFEKFEAEAVDVDTVFVLLTPDDTLATPTDQGNALLRARQNVIFELGYFLAKMGRQRGKVILLYKGKLDLSSDITGLTYVNFDNGIEAAGEDIRRELADFL